MPTTTTSAAADHLIFSLETALSPNDRPAFRLAAEQALAALPPGAIGEGSTYRILREIFRQHFSPPNLDGQPRWAQEERTRQSPTAPQPPLDVPKDFSCGQRALVFATAGYVAPGVDAATVSMARIICRFAADLVNDVLAGKKGFVNAYAEARSRKEAARTA